jgi:hypothetical protein
MHERTRLLVCRAGFLILCALPTLFVSAAAVHYRSSNYLEAQREEWASVLSDKLGLEVQIGRISYPHWNVALLEEVTLADPETGREVLRTRYVEITKEENRWRLATGQPEVDGRSLPLLAELVNYRLLRGPGVQFPPLDVEIGALTIRSDDAAQTFQQLKLELVTTESGKRASATFFLAGIPSATPMSVVVERRRSESSPTTTCTFQAGDAPVPCGAFAPLWPWLDQLGDDATFSGRVALEQSASDMALEVAGRFEHIDLDRLVSQRFPHHRLSGDATVKLEPLAVRRGVLSEVRGTLQTHGGGEVSRSLLDALAEWLDLSPSDPPQLRPEPLVRYSHLVLGFQLDDQGLSLTGYADPRIDGVIMANATSGPLLSESANPVVPATHFIRALSPQSEHQVPATREAKSLFDLLPLPSLVAPDDSGLPRARMRLRP